MNQRFDIQPTLPGDSYADWLQQQDMDIWLAEAGAMPIGNFGRRLIAAAYRYQAMRGANHQHDHQVFTLPL